MLQSLNSGLNSKILRGLFAMLLLAALAGLVLTDVGGFFRDGGFRRTDLAKVGRTELTLQTFDPLYRRQLQTAGIGADQARAMGLPNMILQQEITRQTLLQAAKRLGIQVSDSYVANHLQKQLKFVPSAGSNRDKLNMVLQSVGLSEAEFVQAIKDDTSAQLLSSTISSQIKAVPTGLQNAVLTATTQTRQAEIVTVKTADLPAIAAADDATLQAYLKDRQDAYQIPEQRDVTIATIAQDKLAPAVNVDPADVQKYYSENEDQFVAPARVQFGQVIAPDEKTAQDIFAAAQKDKNQPDLQPLAAARKAQFLKTDWYDKAALPAELAAALFDGTTPRTGLLPPVKSAIGWHVMVAQGFQPEGRKSFDAVKGEIAELLKQERLDNDVNRAVEEIENQAADGTALDAIVQPYQGNVLHASHVDKATGRGTIAALKLPEDAQASVLEAATTLNDGDTSPIIESKSGTYLLVHVDKVTEPRLPDFAGIRDRLAADWLKEQRDAQLDKTVNDVIGGYDSKQPDVKAIAAKYKLPYRQTAFLSPDSTNLPPAATNVLFNLSPKNDLTSVRTADGALIVRLNAIKTDAAAAAKPDDKQLEQLRTSMASELQQQFVMGWRTYLGVDINQKLLEETYLKERAKDQE